MLTCADFLAELGSYLEGEIEGDVRRELERHLAHCKTCQVVADPTAKTLKVVTDSGEFDLSEELAEPMVEKIMERIRRLRSAPDESELES